MASPPTRMERLSRPHEDGKAASPTRMGRLSPPMRMGRCPPGGWKGCPLPRGWEDGSSHKDGQAAVTKNGAQVLALAVVPQQALLASESPILNEGGAVYYE